MTCRRRPRSGRQCTLVIRLARNVSRSDIIPITSRPNSFTHSPMRGVMNSACSSVRRCADSGAITLDQQHRQPVLAPEPAQDADEFWPLGGAHMGVERSGVDAGGDGGLELGPELRLDRLRAARRARGTSGQKYPHSTKVALAPWVIPTSSSWMTTRLLRSPSLAVIGLLLLRRHPLCRAQATRATRSVRSSSSISSRRKWATTLPWASTVRSSATDSAWRKLWVMRMIAWPWSRA
jgi:hypothetical protein